MTAQQLKRLRKKQIVTMNIGIFFIPVIFMPLLLLGGTTKQFYLLLFLLLVGTTLFETYRYKTGQFAFTKDMKKLLSYEKEQIGEHTFYQERRRALIIQGFIAFIMGLQYLMANSDPFLGEGMWWLLFLLMLILMPMLTWSIKSRAKKIDEGHTELKDIQRGSKRIGVLTGILVFIVTIVATIIAINIA